MTSAIDRFLSAAEVLGHPIEVRRFPEGTKTAQDAARAVGCDVAQIVKSLVFTGDDDRPILALTSGANRVDTARLATLAGISSVRRATPDEARAATGFAVGGTPPVKGKLLHAVFADETLMRYDEIWAAAGTPDAVFSLTPAELLTLSGGAVAAFAE